MPAPLKKAVILLAALLLVGAARLPFERRLARELKAAHFQVGELNLGVREQAGQMGFLAALSGMRSTVADFLWLRAYVAWTHTEWGRMKLLFDAATSLQPRALLFWDGAAHHMAWNASKAALDDLNVPLGLRIRAQQEYIRLGEDYLLRGIAHNPDSAFLYDILGNLYRDKLLDHCRSAEAFAEAAKRPGAMAYVHRMAAYELARCPGHEEEAYRLLKEYYHRGKQERLLTLLKLLGELEIKLNIPVAERIDTAHDMREATPR